MVVETATRPECKICGAPAERHHTKDGKSFYRSVCWECRPRPDEYWQERRDKMAGRWTTQVFKVVVGSGRDIHCCSLCERTFPFRCDIHHIDEDRSNNSEDNLSVLCPNCHRLMH